MDPHNPIIAETYIKREPWWAVIFKLVSDALLLVVGVWLLTVLLLSLDRVIH